MTGAFFPCPGRPSSTSFNYDVPVHAQLPLIAEAGFSYVSLGENEPHARYLSPAGRAELQDLLDRFALQLDTIHGPRADLPDRVDRLIATAEAAADLGAPVVVFHGGPFGFGDVELPTRLEHLLQVCQALDRIAAATGVVFALDRLDPRHFGLCYDSANDQIGGPRPFALITALRDRIVAVHLSDRVRDFVDHVPPGDGFIDWAALAEDLKASTFRGPLCLEVMMTHAEEKDVRRFLYRAHQRARWLRGVIGP